MSRRGRFDGRGGRATAAAAALLLALLPLVAGCGGEENSGGSDRGRFSIGGRGLNEAVDSVRRSRRSMAARGGGGPEEGQPSRLPPAIQSALDSGNAAYRSGDYRAALERFESVTSDHPDVRAAWFGVYMAQRALGNDAAADSAMQRAGMSSDGATRLHGVAGDSSSTAPHGFMGTDTSRSGP